MKSIRSFSYGSLATLVSVTAIACAGSTEAPPEAPTQTSPPASESAAAAEETADSAESETAEMCGPQSPRDITDLVGTNEVAVPGGETPTLCNVHFHKPLEHAGFNAPPEVSGTQGEPVCQSVDIGDEVEFHWVYTNCEPNASPIKGLANCVCDREDLVLRVYTQAYVISEDGSELAQPETSLVKYAGSTTGPTYTNEKCSPAKVNWEVNPEFEKLSKEKLGEWCESNPWPGEDHPHGVRELVTAPEWLSPMQ